MKTKKICVITGSRSEFWLLRGLIKEINLKKEFELQLIVTGSHLSPEFGMTINNIEDDMVSLLQENESFLENVENIHSLEMYYGDEHLQSLIDQSRELINTFIETQEKYFDVEVEDLEYDDTNKEEETATPEE